MAQYTENLIPIMTSNTTPLPYKTIYSSEWTSAGFHAWNAFDKNLTTNNGWAPNFAKAGEYIGIDFGENNGKIIEKYTIQIDSQYNPIKAFTFEGSNDNSTYTVLDTQPSTTWTANQKKEFIIPNTNNYRYYRIVSKTAGATIIIKEIEMMSAILNKFLIKQNSQYYSIKPEFYQDGQFTPLTLSGGDKPNDDDYNNQGFDDINTLCTDMTVGTDTFKPIDKVNDQFQIKKYIPNS